MNEAKIIDGITQVARQHLEWLGPVERQMRLVEDLELDSMRLFTLAAELENHFRIHLYEDDEATLETVGDLVDTIGRKLAG